MKWIIGIFAAIVLISIITGYTGGAKDATSNYGKVMRGG